MKTRKKLEDIAFAFCGGLRYDSLVLIKKNKMKEATHDELFCAACAAVPDAGHRLQRLNNGFSGRGCAAGGPLPAILSINRRYKEG